MTEAAMGSAPIRVSVGVCAYNEAGRIQALLDSLRGQALPPSFAVNEILVVASGCTDGTELAVRATALSDPRVRLIEEAERLGKASALNRILEAYRGDLLVLVNADAELSPGSLASLLRPFVETPETRVTCGAPRPETERGLPQAVEGVLLELHNRLLADRSAHSLDNHCCDEFMALRRGFIDSFPTSLINDGAYVGVVAALSGHSIHYCEDATVWVRTPSSIRGLLVRRRRILRGHRQIRRLLGRPPSTLESVVRRNPGLVVRIFASEILDRPEALPILALLAMPLELIAVTLAASDEIRRPVYTAAWQKVDTL